MRATCRPVMERLDRKPNPDHLRPALVPIVASTEPLLLLFGGAGALHIFAQFGGGRGGFTRLT
jgi:hypothetical protein